jgi:hypothetical protein
MATKEKNKKTDDLLEQDRQYKIMRGEIKDELCNYSYEITAGKALGFKHNVDGKGVIDEDMIKIAKKLNVHLAVVDDVFSVAGIEIKDIDKFHKHELTSKYVVTGFKITGDEEAESVQLFGSKRVSVGQRMKLESGKIPIDSASSYLHYNELREAVNSWRQEIAEYHEGKFTQVEEEEVVDDKEVKQTKITFAGREGLAPADLND